MFTIHSVVLGLVTLYLGFLALYPNAGNPLGLVLLHLLPAVLALTTGGLCLLDMGILVIPSA